MATRCRLVSSCLRHAGLGLARDRGLDVQVGLQSERKRPVYRAVYENAVMVQATLYTDRIRLVPLSDEHFEHEVELDSDPEVMRYLGNGTARSRDEVELLHRRRLAAANRVSGLGFWAGFVEGQFVGWWILEPPDRADQGSTNAQAELGYRLLRRHWRKGLASEGARELIRYGFEDIGLDRIFAETMAVNAATRATMAAVGMQRVRTFHMHWEAPLAGSELGEVEYAIWRQEWRAQPSAS
jgi:RimJ/RimL family protein N-acetyltransferase